MSFKQNSCLYAQIELLGIEFFNAAQNTLADGVNLLHLRLSQRIEQNLLNLLNMAGGGGDDLVVAGIGERGGSPNPSFPAAQSPATTGTKNH